MKEYRSYDMGLGHDSMDGHEGNNFRDMAGDLDGEGGKKERGLC